MSDTYLPEICDSLFQHHEMVEVDKYYYLSNDKKVLCSECIGPWIERQSTIIAAHLMRPALTIIKHRLDGSLIPGTELSFNDFFPTVDFMEPIIPNGSIYYSLDANVTPSETEDPLGKMETKLSIEINANFHITRQIDLMSQLIDGEHGDLIEANKHHIFEYLKTVAALILRIWLSGRFTVMCKHEVESFIEAHQNAYESTATDNCGCSFDCPHGTSSEAVDECTECGKGLVSPYYVYQNGLYCLDCMYRIVVDASVRCSLSEIVGLAQADEIIPNTTRRYDTTDEFKISVIERYFNYMQGFSNLIKAYRV